MVQPLEDEILQRAKPICRDEGKNWDIGTHPIADDMNIVDDSSRTEYFNRAKQQLVREQANETSPQLS
jgi:hypothetical protein